jgi:hypothetical protein
MNHPSYSPHWDNPTKSAGIEKKLRSFEEHLSKREDPDNIEDGERKCQPDENETNVSILNLVRICFMKI